MEILKISFTYDDVTFDDHIMVQKYLDEKKLQVITSYNVHLMNLMYTLGKTWLNSFIQYPHASSYVRGIENTTFDDNTFMNFAPDMKTYHLPDSGGSYLSRFHNDTSHILLTMAIENIVNYKLLYLTIMLLDYVKFANYIILMTKLIQFHLLGNYWKEKLLRQQGITTDNFDTLIYF